MKAVSFWGLCKITLLNYVDRMTSNSHGDVKAATEIFSPAVVERSKLKRIIPAISARRAPRPHVELKASVREPLAGVGVNVDD